MVLAGLVHWVFIRVQLDTGRTTYPLATAIVGDTYIVNPGSLGQPRNGIPDATYAVWRDGELQIHHLHYDHDTTQRKLMMLPLDPDVVDRLQEILETGSA